MSRSFVYINHCNNEIKPDIEKKVNNAWILYSSPICLAIYPSGVTEFISGEDITNTIFIDKSGTYRIKFSYGFSANNDLDNFVYSDEILVR